MKKETEIAVKYCIGLILVLSVIIGYIPEPQYIIEMTCISNFLLGLVFIISAVRLQRGKRDFPNVVYSMGLVTILLVFFICMGSLSGAYHMNFKGAFIFLHVLNPVIVLIYYLIFIDEKHNGRLRNILMTPFFAIAYLLVDYIVGTMINHYVYGFFEPGELTIPMAFLVGLVIYMMLLLMALLCYGLNRLVRRSEKKGSYTL